MNILIVGAGVVGWSLAEQLSQEGHRVSLVDADKRKIKEIGEKLDVLAVHGKAGVQSVLERAGIRDADMLIAVTSVDEVNLVVGLMASRFGVKHRIVRLRNPEFTRPGSILPLKELGIDHVVNADPVIVGSLTRMIQIPGATEAMVLAGGQVLMLAFDVATDSPAAGKTLAELREVGELDAFLIFSISRRDQLIVPSGATRIEPGDRLHLLASADTHRFLLSILHRRPVPMNRVVITGAARIGGQLAEAIQGDVREVTLIEPDPELASEAAERLKKTTVLQGNETSLDVMQEAGVDKADLFCALSEDDQRNMLAALLAKKQGAAKVAVLVHGTEYVSILYGLGIQIVLNPRHVIVGEASVTPVPGSRAEIIEFEVPAGCQALNAPLKELKFPTNALVGAIVRDGLMRIPNGDSRISAGDTVVVFTLPEAIPRIEKLFDRSRRK